MAAQRSRSSRNATDLPEPTVRENRTYGIITGIAMIVLGVFFLIWPVLTGYVGMLLITVGLIVYGITEIVVYARTPRSVRNGWLLAYGIIYIVLGIILVLETPQEMYLTYAFALGFITMYLGITQCMSYGSLSGAPGAGWLLASGIINIILSICMIMTPLVATWALEYVLGFYLIFGGIALFAEACSGRFGFGR